MRELWTGGEARTNALLRVTALLFLTHLVDGGALKLPLGHGLELVTRFAAWTALGLALVFGRPVLRHRSTWLVVAGCMTWVTLAYFDEVGNHQYVLTYVAVLMVLACDRDPDTSYAVAATGLRWMLVAIMGFAALQKAVNPEFRDGSFIAFMFAQGLLFEPVLKLCGSCWDAVLHNQQAMAAAAALDPNGAVQVPLAPPLPLMPLVSHGFTWLTLAIELLVAVAFAVVPSQAIRHGLLIAFVATLAVMRPEHVFAATLATIGLWLCPARFAWAQRTYLVLAIGLMAAAFAA